MGLREQKKQLTRRHIADIATGMFFERGFDNVTVAEVAEAAGVSKMTVFNYFPRKEDLFLDRHADRLAEVEQVLRERGPGKSVAAALREYHQKLVADRHPLSATVPGAGFFLRAVHESPALVNRTYEQSREIVDKMADVLMAEGEQPGQARLIAAMTGATVDAVYEYAANRMIAGEDPDLVHAEQAAYIDKAFDLLETGIGDYGSGE
ncbi:TetR family transcriptional regulator [Amycolatopsis acidicola]|uniref:TetR family transcriptional regulator n=1 Tax=Amycolatopsis acidicola TaxID=2596893 RepID=A0A5N0VK75_9PSEU|nr:TetR family transcriptional regulator [Amycolatopsis acidicola]KAA9165754.1 TetR family transcriptional regulator [Amycolatopsis acidicola]